MVLFYLMCLICLVEWAKPGLFLNFKSFNKTSSPGLDLELWLGEFQWEHRQQLPKAGKIPSYKFYSEILQLLLELARKVGGSFQASVIQLREALLADRQFELRLRELIHGCYWQMTFMIILTWVFIIFSSFMTEVKVRLLPLALIALWQIIGVGSLPVAIRWLRRKYFSDLALIWKALYVMKSLALVPMPRSEILTLAGIPDLDRVKNPNLQALLNKLQTCCRKALQVGNSWTNEVEELIGELRFLEKWHYQLFEKRLSALKLLLMGVFFLPSYLGYVLLLLNDLFTLM